MSWPVLDELYHIIAHTHLGKDCPSDLKVGTLSTTTNTVGLTNAPIFKDQTQCTTVVIDV